MRKSLLLAACSCAAVFFTTQTLAQVKGNPVFTASPKPVHVLKTSSRLNPDLQKLNASTSAARLQLPSGEKPFIPNDALNKYLQITNGKIVVDITVKQDMAATKLALQKIGLQVTGVFGRVISGLIPVSALPQLENLSAVQFARPAYQPMKRSAAGSMPAGFYGNKTPASVISQGDTAQRSNIARGKYKVSGKGVKVGILSDSYDKLGTAAIAVSAGELPGKGNPFSHKKPVVVLEDYFGSNATDEGRAMAEIVHDVAPGAEIAFHTAFIGEADFAQGIQDLADNGCKVITDDVSYFDEPFFQDGIIAQSVDLARKKGVSYFSAAGNNSNSSYESDYRGSADEVLGPGSGTAHNFSAPGDFPRYFQPIYIPSGGHFIASFQWDEPVFSACGTGTASDLDIYLIDINGNIVGGGTTNNIASGDPIEVFGYDNNTPDYTFFIVINKFSGPDPTRVKYNIYSDGQFYSTTPAIPGLLAPTLVGHAKADGAIAIAAAFYGTTPAYGTDTAKVEWFSSLGGVANYFDVAGNRIAPVTRRKPELTAPDGGNTSFFDPFGNGDITDDKDTYPNFFGTSAAAPHAAGVAALMLDAEKHNNLTPNQVKGIMAANTSDMDNIYTDGFDKGFDLNTGTGLLKADDAVGAVTFPTLYIKDLKVIPVCSVDPATSRSWKIVNPNPFDVESHWLLLGTNQQATITAAPGETVFSSTMFSWGSFAMPNILILDWNDNFGFTRLDIENSSSAKCGMSSTRTAAETQQPLPKLMIADVYPNPSTNTFRVYLALADQQPIQLQLFSIDGKQLLQKQVSQNKGIVPIDATPYKAGVYMLQIRQGSFNKTIKLIKQ